VRNISIIQWLQIAGVIFIYPSSFSQIQKIDPIIIESHLLDSMKLRNPEDVFSSVYDNQKVSSESFTKEPERAIIAQDSSDSLIQVKVDISPDTLVIVDNSKFRLRFRKVKNEAFQVGEYLEFAIGWKFFKAGTATMSVEDTVWNKSRPCYHIKTTANSSSVIDVFYKVRDRVESIVDREGIFPWKFKKHLREGHFRRDRYTTFDPFHNLAFVKNDTVIIPPYVQDILSSFYYVRTLPLQVGKHFDIENISDKKVYPLRVLVHRKERVKVPAGKFDCLVVEPVLRGEGLFNQKGRLTIWMTDDKRKIPVMMKSEIFIGTVDVKLKKYLNTIQS